MFLRPCRSMLSTSLAAIRRSGSPISASAPRSGAATHSSGRQSSRRASARAPHWRTPQHAAKLLEERQPDRSLAALWRQFSDSDLEDSAPSAADFPAWLLLHEPGLSQQLPEDLPPGESASEEHYRCVHRWIQARRTRQSAEELALRRELQVRQPMLFDKLMSTV